VALFELCLVVLSPFWHHDHHEPTLAAALRDGAADERHMCGTGNHATDPGTNCPMCLCQRLLAHGVTENSATPPTASASGTVCPADAPLVGAVPHEPTRLRGPPAA
jgi:hypothetical protein